MKKESGMLNYLHLIQIGKVKNYTIFNLVHVIFLAPETGKLATVLEYSFSISFKGLLIPSLQSMAQIFEKQRGFLLFFSFEFVNYGFHNIAYPVWILPSLIDFISPISLIRKLLLS